MFKKREHVLFYANDEAALYFGQIETFVTSPSPHAVLRPMKTLQTTLINKAGHPCRASLIQEVDLLNSFINPVDLPSSQCELELVPVEHIVSKVVIVYLFNCITQPNTIERH